MHILDKDQARQEQALRELRREVEKAERRGYARGLRDGYTSRVLDVEDAREALHDASDDIKVREG